LWGESTRGSTSHGRVPVVEELQLVVGAHVSRSGSNGEFTWAPRIVRGWLGGSQCSKQEKPFPFGIGFFVNGT
ncbi:MAG: hypothetical protein ACR2OA_08545, partial [Rubripirellula sp.]